MNAKKKYELFLQDTVFTERLRSGHYIMYDYEIQLMDDYVKEVYTSAVERVSISLYDFLTFVDFIDMMRIAQSGNVADVLEKAFIMNAETISQLTLLRGADKNE